MRLIGAKEFLKTVKPGTLYSRFWLDTEKECLDLIHRYRANDELYYWRETEIFGDNDGSLGFTKPSEFDVEDVHFKTHIINGKKYDYLSYYDANVVGDAGPTTTLYLVYDTEDEWPEQVPIDNSDDYVTKSDLISIRDWFLDTAGPFRDETKDGWALIELETNSYYKDNRIINYSGEEKDVGE